MPQEKPTLEQLVEAFAAARRRGERPDAHEVAGRHPELGEELLHALEAAQLLGELAAGDEGRALGPYRLLRELGRGGMGVVYEALDTALGRRVALKLLPPELLSSASLRARFRREAELAARLSHPSVCAVYAAGIEQGTPWIAMELVLGETLARRIERSRTGDPHGGRPPGREVAALLAGVARALDAAHALGVVHRDVKPANVMVTPEGRPVLLDFGLARTDEAGEPWLTRTGENPGTPAYLAPEIVSGELARPDARCDVYALGVTLYECLALERPFRAPTPAALYREILSGAPPRPAHGALPRDLFVVAATAMERDRARRYASAADLAADLEAYAAGRPIAARPVSALGRLARWARREPRLAGISALLAGAVVALAVAGGILLASRDEVRAAETERRARDVEAEVVEGFTLLVGRAYGQADAAFARALALDPAHAEALAGRAFASLDRGRPDEALAQLEGAPGLAAFERLRRAARGEAPAELDPDAAGVSALDLFVAGELHVRTCFSLPPSGRAACARPALDLLDEAMLRLPVARALYHTERAYAAQAAGDAAAARSAAEALAALWPDSARELCTAGEVLVKLDPVRACELLERAARLDPHDPHQPAVQHNLGTAYLLAGDPAQAERCFARVLESETIVEGGPGSVLAHACNGLGLALVDLGRPEEARAHYERALEHWPDMVEALGNLGLLETKLGEHRQAAETYERALALDPGDAGNRYNYGNALYWLEEYERAREQFELVLELDPGFDLGWAGLAWALLALERPEEAREAVERGLERAPDSEALARVQGQVRVALERSD